MRGRWSGPPPRLLLNTTLPKPQPSRAVARSGTSSIPSTPTAITNNWSRTALSTAAVIPHTTTEPWVLPARGIVGMACLIAAESAIFIIFIVAYLYYLGKSITGPTPSILEIPIFTSICLFSSSATVHFAVSALDHGRRAATSLWLAATVLLGGIFSLATKSSYKDK